MAFVSFVIFLSQSIILIQNFNTGDTFRTTREVDFEGPLPSPTIIICQDPGATNISEELVRLSPGSADITISKLATVFKVNAYLKGFKEGRGSFST